MQRASRLGGAGPKPVPPDGLRKLSPWLFAVVVVCFFLPFVTCNGVTATGMQAATGLSPPGSDRAAVEAFRGQTAVPNPFRPPRAPLRAVGPRPCRDLGIEGPRHLGGRSGGRHALARGVRRLRPGPDAPRRHH